ncbi:MAG: FAD-binding protein [Polyangiaceae bacterium]|nr:FAD-binding protein [Polyangiaceae bacterium]
MDYDVIVAGAGSAGAATALGCARRGLRVLCVDRRPLDDAGARWVNAVPARHFDLAEVPPPSGAELRAAAGRFHLFVGEQGAKLTVEGHDALEVDMRRLVQRLQTLAAAAGAELRGGVEVHRKEAHALVTSAGRLTARYFVDASGMAGVGLLGAGPPRRRDVCAAAQQVRALADRRAAEEFVAHHGAAPGETLSFAGRAGGYSVVNVRLEGDEVSLLAGSIPADGHPPGSELLARFAAEHRWLGPVVFGGARAIPLGRPHARLVSGDTAAVGDAACQVFSAHGSGVGMGMIAAARLAGAIAGDGGLRQYEARFHAEWGALLAVYDEFRRLSQRLRPWELEQLVARGLLDAEGASAGMRQELPRLGARRAARLAVRAASAPGLARPLLATGARAAVGAALRGASPRAPALSPLWSRVATVLDRR